MREIQPACPAQPTRFNHGGWSANSNNPLNRMKRLPLQSVSILFIPLLLWLSACESLNPLTFWQAQPVKKLTESQIQEKIAEIKTIYIQSLTGNNQKEIKKMLFGQLSKQGYHLVDILPDSTEGLGVLRMKVEDFTLWENEEYPKEALSLPEAEKIKQRIIRRNILVGLRLDLFDGETGLPLIRDKFSQPFQQIYVGLRQIEARPKKNKELLRLTQILTHKILSRFAGNGEEEKKLELERGEGYGWLAEEVHDTGDYRLLKGNALAQNGEYEKAIMLYRIVLFSPREKEPEEVYIKNRGAAFFNLGQVYHHLGDYLYAAKMYSQANRLQQKLTYAQSWGDNMHAWLESHKQKSKPKAPQRAKKKKLPPPPPPPESKLVKIQKNEALLLDPTKLWPLEPLIKRAEKSDLNGIDPPKASLYPQNQGAKKATPQPQAEPPPPPPQPEPKPKPKLGGGMQLIQPN